MRPCRIAAILVAAVVVSPSVNAETRDEEAKRHFLQGTKEFNLADYDRAVVEYEAAYRLADDPAFLYNIAQAHRLAGRLEKSIRFYRNFLRLVPETNQRKEIEARIVEMEHSLETQRSQQVAPPSGVIEPQPKAPESATPATTAPEPPPLTTTEPAPAKRPLKPAGIGLLVAGVVIAVGGGLGFGAVANSNAQAIADEASSHQMFDPSHESARKSFATLALVSWVVGGVVAATGGVLLGLGLRATDHAPAASALRLVPVAAPDGGGLCLMGGF